jgi:hypothetical protein
MAAKRKKKSKRSRKRPNTPLSSHKRHGKQVLSPLGSLPKMKALPWLQDMFPDFLWPCFHLTDDIDSGLAIAARTLDAVNDALDEALGNSPEARPSLDGSLLSWDQQQAGTPSRRSTRSFRTYGNLPNG